MELDNAIIESFREEAAERLAELESVLLALERAPANTELVAQAFRALHTIKGSGAMFGFVDVASFAHELETIFDQVRNGRVAVTRDLVGLTLSSKDLIRRMLAGADDDTAPEREKVVAALRAFAPAQAAQPNAPLPKPQGPPGRSEGFSAPPAEPVPVEKTYRVMFRPDTDVFRNGTNPLGIFRELAELGKTHVIAYTGGIPSLEDFNPETCYLHWDIILTTARGLHEISEAFVFVEDRSQIRIDIIDDGESPVDGADSSKRLGAILIERGEITSDQLRSILKGQRKVGELLVERGFASQEVVDAAILEQQVLREARARRDVGGQVEPATSVRVSAEKLDSLVDLVSELVIAQARLGQLAANREEDPELLSVTECIDRLSSELRDNTLKIRMVPIGTTFARFKRLVRDIAAELGKEIELVTEGAETELDKTVIERLGDPLVHIIRNSCDHGIERPDRRVAAGKSVMGTVRLRAYHTGPNVIVEVQDDGAGLDVARIRQKAAERELITPDSRLSDAEIMKLIFLPGFSTAQAVSKLSGRGVGMDVVKRSIDALRGAVEIDSVLGQGTTIRLRLPLTLAIIEGLLVHVGGAHYVIPMSLVEECIELTQSEVERVRDRQMATVRGELVPYLRLREWFAVSGDRPPIEQIVIASAEGFRFGFVVDAVVGQHQTVIKTLGRLYQRLQGLSGATILGDGTVALIVDVPALIRSAGTAGALPN